MLRLFHIALYETDMTLNTAKEREVYFIKFYNVYNIQSWSFKMFF